jgi:hypothetical protein
LAKAAAVASNSAFSYQPAGAQVSHIIRVKAKRSSCTVRSPRGVAMYQWYQ